MIDWLTLRVCSEFAPQAGHVVSIDGDGVVEWRTPKRQMVEGSHSARVSVRTVPWGGKHVLGNLEISGNPSKFLQGHNLFGSDDLLGVARAFIRAVFASVGFEPSANEQAAIDQGAVWLTRIDVNRNSDFGTEPRALAAIRALAECAHLSHRGRGSLVGEGTVYWGQKSRYFSLKAYAKRQELRKHPLCATLPMVTELQRFSEGIVRREATISGRELRHRKLHVLLNWAKLGVTPGALFDELFGRLTISEATMKEPAELDQVPPKLRSVYQLWADGHDLRTIFARPTFYRHRKALLALGVDIAVKQPREVSNVVPLVVTLVGREVGVPDWARGTPLYFDPRQHRAA